MRKQLLQIKGYLMNNNAMNIVQSIWMTQAPNNTARIAVASSTEPEIRLAAAYQPMTAQEVSVFAAGPMSEEDTTLMLNAAEITGVDDIKCLCETPHVDRAFRRSLLSTGRTYINVSIEEQHQLALDLEPGEGFDDLVIAMLPYWVSQRFDFDVETLLAKSGPVAGAQLLAATGPAQMSDDRIMHWIDNPPTRWENPDPEKAWHESRHAGDALTMAFTHRPGIVDRVRHDPHLLRRALDTPHWRPEFAYDIPGVDLKETALLEDSHTMPGTLLSLVWNPRTPIEQAEAICDIAIEAIDTSPFADGWKITAGAAETRLRVQQWHVDDFNDLQDPVAISRMANRIQSNFKKWNKEQDKHLNGRQHGHALTSPRRFPEFAALLTNPYATEVHRVRDFNTTVETLPEGTWTHEQFKTANRLSPIYLPKGKRKKRAPMQTPQAHHRIARLAEEEFANLTPQAHHRIARLAEEEFANLPQEDQAFAWTILVSLVSDTDGCPSVNVVETALAVAA